MTFHSIRTSVFSAILTASSICVFGATHVKALPDVHQEKAQLGGPAMPAPKLPSQQKGGTLIEVAGPAMPAPQLPSQHKGGSLIDVAGPAMPAPQLPSQHKGGSLIDVAGPAMPAPKLPSQQKGGTAFVEIA